MKRKRTTLTVHRIVVLNGVSLAVGLTVNLILLSRFSRGPNFFVSHCVVVVGWLISSVLLIITVIMVSLNDRLPPPHDNTFSQAFFYACFAAGLYFVVSSLMILSVHGSRLGYYTNESRWVRNERALPYQTIIFKIYVLGGAAIFSRIEKWNFLDAVFWADCTILTIGLGDYSPKTHLGRSLLFIYTVGGVLQLGLMITSIQSFTKRRQERTLRSAIKEKRVKLLKRWERRCVVPFLLHVRECDDNLCYCTKKSR